MQYRSIANLNDTIIRNLHRLPNGTDIVIGVPRSGLLAGTMMALALNVPIWDVEGFVAGRMLATGRTRKRSEFQRGIQELKNVLVVDDSIHTGQSLISVRQKLESARPDVRFTFLAVYGERNDQAEADLILEIVPMPRVFQWNVLHHVILEQSCVDIDGILCIDPTDAQNDDGEAYVRFLLDAPSLHRPTRTIGYLVTSRLEKYRPQTEAWLASRDISYQKLLMLDLSSKEERQRSGSHAKFKGEEFRRLNSPLFIESDARQAPEICRISGKPVLCLETQEMHLPEALSPVAVTQKLRALGRRGPSRMKIAARGLLGDRIDDDLKRRWGRSESRA